MTLFGFLLLLLIAARYLKLIGEKPHVIRQAPLKYIAAYLGITDASLSRIRKEIVFKS